MEFFRQEYWNGLPFPTPGDLPDPGTEPTSPVSPALQADKFFLFIYFSWRLITLQYCSGFYHTLIDSLSAVLQQLKKPYILKFIV